jgi:hypothetical protein
VSSAASKFWKVNKTTALLDIQTLATFPWDCCRPKNRSSDAISTCTFLLDKVDSHLLWRLPKKEQFLFDKAQKWMKSKWTMVDSYNTTFYFFSLHSARCQSR